MLEFIAQYWIEAAFAAVIAVIAGLYKKVRKYFRREELMEDAIIAILHDRLYALCSEYIQNGSVTVPQLRNLGYLYRSYHALGGNSTGTALYEKVKSLPVKEG